MHYLIGATIGGVVVVVMIWLSIMTTKTYH